MPLDTSKLKIVYAPDEILRKVCEPVKSSDDVKSISKKMIEIMKLHGGIGLAANQAGVGLRLFVMQVGNMKNPKVCINPVILHGCVPVLGSEGCLSEPGLTQEVVRHKFILIKYTDINGKVVQEHMKEIEARCAQHEIEHLDGKLISDYNK